jgi:hypothetical protein
MNIYKQREHVRVHVHENELDSESENDLGMNMNMKMSMDMNVTVNMYKVREYVHAYEHLHGHVNVHVRVRVSSPSPPHFLDFLKLIFVPLLRGKPMVQYCAIPGGNPILGYTEFRRGVGNLRVRTRDCSFTVMYAAIEPLLFPLCSWGRMG